MKKILIVAMADSVHTARWLRQFDDEEIEFVLFPSTPHRRIHPLISDHGLKTLKSKITISKWMKRGGLPLGVLDLLLDNRLRAKLLAKLITAFDPDLIHVMETQHAGYLTDRALSAIRRKPKLVLSIWGSDLFWFQRFPRHQQKIRSLLKRVDALLTECQRDEELATNFGFKGVCIYGVPASGGFDTQDILNIESSISPSKRKIIAVKGYSGFVGLGPAAINAVGRTSDLADKYRTVVFSASWRTWFVAKIVKFRTGLNIEVQMKHSRSLEEMRDLFSNSRVVLGVSKSDGLPATVKETAFFGAFPIQTDTSCAGEWFKDGISILLVPPDSTDALESALRTALIDDDLVDSAAMLNFEIAGSLMNRAAVRSKISLLYD
jgi:glycosyltransferase involved in cell wall biosynthesis